MPRDRSELEIDSDLPEELVEQIRRGYGIGRLDGIRRHLYELLGEYGETSVSELMAGVYRRQKQKSNGAVIAIPNRKNIQSHLSKMGKDGLAERVGVGVWRLTEAGAARWDRELGETP